MSGNIMIRSITLCLAALIHMQSFAATSAPVVPVIKNGPCPPGYYTSGNYCTPGDRATPLIEKSGPCPPGYYTSGNYCAGRSDSRLAVPKVGPCPPGYYTSGNYCIKS